MPQTYIKTITDKDGNTIAPRTRVEAITLSDGVTNLEDQLIKLEDGIPSDPMPIDADTLEGHNSSYFATVTDLSAKAEIDSQTFTGTPKAPTAAIGTNTTQIATTAFVRSEVAALVDSSPTALDTLNELAAALGDDPNFATTVNNSIATKAPINSPTFTGTVNGITSSMVGLGNVTNESKSTMFNNPTFNGAATATSFNIGSNISIIYNTTTKSIDFIFNS